MELLRAEPDRTGVGGFIRSLGRHLRPHRLQVVALVALMLLDLAVEAGWPLGLQLLIDRAILPRSARLLAIILTVLAAAGLAAAAAGMLRDWLYSRMGTRVVNGLRFQLFSHLQRLSMGFHARSQVGDLLSRFSNDLASVEQTIVTALPTALRALLGLLVSAVLLFTIEWRLALVAVLGVVLCFRGAQRLEPRASRANHRMREELGRVAAVVQENLSAQPVVKGFSLEALMERRLTGLLAGLFGLSVRATFLSHVVERVPNVGVLFTGLLILAGGGCLAFQGEITVGELVAFQGLFLNVTVYVAGFTWAIPHLLAGSSGMERIEEIFGEKPQVADPAGAPALRPLAEAIEFRHVRFSYTGERPSLDEVNLSIPRGCRAAFVGPSGSGKSTVLALILRFYDPEQGAVCMDGQDLRGVTQESLRRQMGVVFQDSVLFDTTVRENIRMGRQDATDAEIETAAKLAGIHDVIRRLPQGYDTAVGERGGRLSGGQRQRLGIARAILRDPAILILDEATSALDPATEAAVNATLYDLGRNRTVIAVTHRLASVVHADRILVMDGGRLVESGRHDELLRRDGVYAGLWRKQAGLTLGPDGARAQVSEDRLRAMPLFAGMDAALLVALARDFVTERHAAGREIIREGDPGDRFYMIVRGKVTVYRRDAGGSERQIAILADGDCFGEMALLTDAPRSATVRTLTDTVLLALARDRFHALMERHPQVRESLMRTCAERAIADKNSGADPPGGSAGNG